MRRQRRNQKAETISKKLPVKEMQRQFFDFVSGQNEFRNISLGTITKGRREKP
jgi:hypothetical protein